MDQLEGTIKIELRDLGSLLREKFGKNLIIVEQSSDQLLSSGENYGSTILKVHVTIKRNDDAEEETLDLVAKMLPTTDFQRRMFDSSYTFKKEIFLYAEALPAYQRLERRFGVVEDEVFDILPKLYGSRLSLRADGDVDQDAVILMQNLKAEGYYMADRRKGVDVPHARLALQSLARFHALGIAVKQHNPAFFKVLRNRAVCLNTNGINFDDVTDHFRQLMLDDPVMSAHRDQFKAAMSSNTVQNTWTRPQTEPWCTIVHSDFWINNIMFRKDGSGKVRDVKFVDFQNFLFLSPLRDLVFFVVANLSDEAMSETFDELVEYYREEFTGWLQRMECDVKPFGKEAFYERMRLDAYEEFSHCPFMIKILTASVRKESVTHNLKDLFLCEDSKPLFLERLRRCVSKYVEKGWLNPV